MPKRPQLSDRLKPAADPRGADAYFGPSPASSATAPRSRQRATGTGKQGLGTQQPGTAARIPETVSRPNPPALAELLAQPARRGPKWDEANQRASYYLPVELLRQLDRVASPALSKSQIVTAALQHYLRGAIVRDQ